MLCFAIQPLEFQRVRLEKRSFLSALRYRCCCGILDHFTFWASKEASVLPRWVKSERFSVASQLRYSILSLDLSQSVSFAFRFFPVLGRRCSLWKLKRGHGKQERNYWDHQCALQVWFLLQILLMLWFFQYRNAFLQWQLPPFTTIAERRNDYRTGNHWTQHDVVLIQNLAIRCPAKTDCVNFVCTNRCLRRLKMICKDVGPHSRRSSLDELCCMLRLWLTTFVV